MKIYELARELNVPNKELIGALNDPKRQSHMNTVNDEEAAALRKQFGKNSDATAVKEEKPAPKKEAKEEVKPEPKAETKSEPKTEAKPEIRTERKPETKPEVKEEAKQERKSHIVSLYNPHNSQKNKDGKAEGRVNSGSGRDSRNNRNFNNNGDNRNGGNGSSADSRNSGNRDNRDGFRRDGSRDNRNGNTDNRNGGNRDNRDGFRRDGSRDNRNGSTDNRNGGNRDNRDGFRRDGSRDNRNGSTDNRNSNRNAGNGFRRDNNGEGRDNRFNRSNRDNRDGGFNKDKDGQRENNFRSQKRDNRESKSNSGADFIVTKPDSRRVDNRKNDRDDKKKDRDGKENSRFISDFQKNREKKEKKEEETIKTLVLPDTLTIKELAEKMKVQPSVVVKKLFMQGKIVTINQDIDFDTAEEIALEFNCICEHEVKVDVIAELLKEDEEAAETMEQRPPVVCVMGHVDHGKTSLLDAIRSTNVTAKESGGITQHIGAYTVEINNQQITFLDTPGHEAFTAMRMRGAMSTDIAILVVAADDGVMPQTVEAINHAKAAGVEIIVAINKIDKPNANIERVKQELTEYDLIPEDWGGSTIFCPVSAHTKEGIDNLLEMILLCAEILELKANPNRKARGLVIEAQLDKGKGPVATVLVQKGTLRVGDSVAAGSCYGKIRAMTDDKGRKVREAGPSVPVEIQGLNDVPNAGEIIVATENDKEARNFAETFIREGREKLLDDTKTKLSLDDLFSQIQAGNLKELGIIIKADVQGSVEAVKQSLLKLSNDEVVVKVIHGGVGNINESDVTLASASNAIIIGFNVKPDNQARIVADREKVDLRLYKVIYNAIEDVEAALKGMLEPTYEEVVVGHAEIKQIFKASGIGNIAGAIVVEGRITRNSKVRITRDGEQIFEGPLASLKRFKDEVKEVKAGYECGLVFENFGDIKEEDKIEAYEMVEVPR